MKILIIGGGGREHAMAAKISENQKVNTIFMAPGNPGCETCAKVQTVRIQADDLPALLHFAQDNKIDLTIVGPELPLSKGIVDLFQANHLAIFGPSQNAAQLESSKSFSKIFMQKYAIPTAHFATFRDPDAAKHHIKKMGAPIVLKLDGLASGKGVIVAMNEAEALAGVDRLFEMGKHNCELVIEAYLEGEELSFIVITDGVHAFTLPPSQDHKRLNEGDTGPNTGGMGVYAPSRLITPELHQTILETIIHPTLKNMAAEGNPFVGFLYAGLMISKTGVPLTLEFNARLGDPETEVILPLMQDDLLDLILLALEKKLPEKSATLKAKAAIGVILANSTYPDGKPSHDPISLPATIPDDHFIFHAGTSKNEKNEIVASGGRVLCVTALGNSFQEAQTKAYALIESIHWPHRYFRKDIGWRVMQ